MRSACKETQRTLIFFSETCVSINVGLSLKLQSNRGMSGANNHKAWDEIITCFIRGSQETTLRGASQHHMTCPTETSHIAMTVWVWLLNRGGGERDKLQFTLREEKTDKQQRESWGHSQRKDMLWIKRISITACLLISFLFLLKVKLHQTIPHIWWKQRCRC